MNAIAPTVFRSPLTAWIFEDTEKAKGGEYEDDIQKSVAPVNWADGPINNVTKTPLTGDLKLL